MNTLQINTTRRKKLATIVSDQKCIRRTGKHLCFLFLFDEESCYVLPNRNNSYKFLGSDSVNLRSVHHSFLKTPVNGASCCEQEYDE